MWPVKVFAAEPPIWYVSSYPITGMTLSQHFLSPILRMQAIVAGANLFLGPDMAMSLNNQGLLSPDGRCWSFDERANGYGRGEGFGAIVLKRLDDALRDKDAVRAVIRATGTNQDGRTPGIAQPSRDAQAQLIRQTYKRAGLDMNQTRYVEAHGTGTLVGGTAERT